MRFLAVLAIIAVAALAVCVWYFARSGRRYYAEHPDEAAEAKLRIAKAVSEQRARSELVTANVFLGIPLVALVVLAASAVRNPDNVIPKTFGEIVTASIAVLLGFAMFIIGLLNLPKR